MIKTVECNKICLKADEGKMLCNASIDTYTPKAYLFAEAEETEWMEVDESELPVEDEELSDSETLEILLGGAV